MRTDLRTAHVISKLVNCDLSKLPMHGDQLRESAWQYLAAATERGRRTLTQAGLSVRTLAEKFQISTGTAHSMTRRVTKIDLREFPPKACDPASGFPYWRQVNFRACPATFADVSDDVRDRHRAEKLARMIDKDGVDAFVRSVRLLGIEAAAEAVEALAEALPAEPADY